MFARGTCPDTCGRIVNETVRDRPDAEGCGGKVVECPGSVRRGAAWRGCREAVQAPCYERVTGQGDWPVFVV